MDSLSCKKSRLHSARLSLRPPWLRPTLTRYPLRHIVKLIDGGNAIKLPLVQLECGHEIRTNAIRLTRCAQCPQQSKSCQRGHPQNAQNSYYKNGKYIQCRICARKRAARRSVGITI